MAAELQELQGTVVDLREEQLQLATTVEALSSQLEEFKQAAAAAAAAAAVASDAEEQIVEAAAAEGSDAGSELISKADALHASNEVDALYELLKDADASDDELAWRIARACHDKAEDSEAAARDKTYKEQLLRDGLAIAERSKESSGSGYALKWYGILLGRLGDFLPTKEKVGNSYKIKEALEAAAQLLPQDASIQTALGQWCYKVASISWIERNVAKALFGAPPESSYEEALGFVTRSHDIRPSKKAALFAGLCHAKLQAKPDAAEWLERCLAMESVGESDLELDKQATAELAKVR